MARWAADAAKEAGAEVRLLKAHELAPDVAIDSNPLWRKNVNETADIPEATSADLEWADGIIFSSPSRFGVMASQLKQFIDLQGGLWAQGKLANKAVTAMATAGNPHGGQEEVIQSIYTVMQHWSTILVPTGYINQSTFGAGGNPYGSSATISQDGEEMAHFNTDGVLCPHCQNILHYKFITYSNLGKYYCPNCDFKRPELAYRLTEMVHTDHESSEFKIEGETFKINVGGLYNVYNALSAYSIGRIFDVPPADIRKGFELSEKVFGRQESIKVGDKEIIINLVKNPVGLNQILEMIALDPEPFSLVSVLNANYADGIDISWIWDANYEKIQDMNIQQVTASGERVEDIAIRLEVAGVPKEDLKVIPNLQDVIKDFKNAPTNRIYVLATYTAVLQLRKELANQGHVKEGM